MTTRTITNLITACALALATAIGPTASGKAAPPAAAKTTASVHTDVTASSGVDAAALDRHFARYGGKLAGKGAVFMEMERKYGVSASFMAAIATQESSCGASARARRVNDCFGMTGARRGYASIDENIEAAFKLVSGRLYVGSGRKTPHRIGSRYCASGGWAGKVAGHMRRIAGN